MTSDDTMRFFFTHHNRTGYVGQTYEDVAAAGMIMPDTDFAGIGLKTSSFRNCDFTKGFFRAADLKGCVFEECDLRGAVFEDIDGTSVMFVKCKMEGISFMHSSIEGLVMDRCVGKVDLMNARLADSTFYHCAFKWSDLMGTDLSEATFLDCDLSKCRINKKTCIAGTVFTRTNITDTELSIASGCTLTDLSDAVVMPFSGIDQLCFALPSDRSLSSFMMGSPLPTGPVSVDIYKNVNFSAHLYCADLDEFRKIR